MNRFVRGFVVAIVCTLMFSSFRLEIANTRMLWDDQEPPPQTVKKGFVLYASIFGNYRNEEKKLSSALQPFNSYNVTRILFTDSTTLNAIPGWDVVTIETGDGMNGIPAPRVRIKEIKFRGHESLRNYRYWIHFDTSRRSIDNAKSALDNGLMQYVECHPSKALFVRKHPVRKNIEQEVGVLKRMPNFQPRYKLDSWDFFLSNEYAKWNRVRLPELNVFVLDSLHEDFLRQWASICDTLLEWGLWRDQIVFSFSMHDYQDMVEYIDTKHRMACPSQQSNLTTLTGPRISLTSSIARPAPKFYQRHTSRKCLVPDNGDDCPVCDEHGLTIGVLYKDEVKYLSAILDDWSRWSARSKLATEFIVVDDGSDVATSASVVVRKAAAGGKLPIVRILTVLDRLEWNIGGARNLVMHAAQRCRVIVHDNDYLLPEPLVSELVETWPGDVIYRLKRNHPGKTAFHPGIMYTTRSTYFHIGGADEDFVGHYGSTDPHLVWRAGLSHVPVKVFESSAKLLPQAMSLARPRRERDPSVNKHLFKSKQKGEIPWSSTYLRFRWIEFTTSEIHMSLNPQRAHFADLFLFGGYRSGAEIGVASGRFSEHILKHGRPDHWIMVEPFPNQNLASRLPAVRACSQYVVNKVQEESTMTWADQGIGQNTNISFLPYFSLQDEVLSVVQPISLDFVYLDGAHDYKNVKAELEPWYERLRPGGMLAGHDYQYNRDFQPLGCNNCHTIPLAQSYTDYGVAHGKPKRGLSGSQAGVVRAVQEWMVEKHPNLTVHFTEENFTRQTMAMTGYDYDLVITNTRNPSWYFIKPMVEHS